MANSLYSKARQKLLKAQINWESDTIKAMLVDINGAGSYSANMTTDEFLSIIPVGSRVASSTLLNRIATADGAADADDTIWLAVPYGNAIEAIVIYKDTGDAATSPLIAYIDTSQGLPITPNGGDIIVVWDNGVNRIFRV